jgi:hypothetical protein
MYSCLPEEPMSFETYRRHNKLNINLDNFPGFCCVIVSKCTVQKIIKLKYTVSNIMGYFGMNVSVSG